MSLTEKLRYLDEAEAVVAHKKWSDYYPVFVTGPDGVEDGYEVVLSTREVAFLKDLLARNQRPLYALKEHIPFYDKLTPPFYRKEAAPYAKISTIEWEKPVHRMAVTVVGLLNATAELEKMNLEIPIEKEDYLILLAWKMQHRAATFQQFGYEYPEIFRRVSDEIENLWYLGMPYIVFLDEVETDVRHVLGERNHNRAILSASNEDTGAGECLLVRLGEKKLHMEYRRHTDFQHAEICCELFDIDAIALEQAFGVTTYAALADTIRDWFGDFEHMDAFTNYLKEHGIAYQKRLYEQGKNI